MAGLAAGWGAQPSSPVPSYEQYLSRAGEAMKPGRTGAGRDGTKINTFPPLRSKHLQRSTFAAPKASPPAQNTLTGGVSPGGSLAAHPPAHLPATCSPGWRRSAQKAPLPFPWLETACRAPAAGWAGVGVCSSPEGGSHGA